MSDSDSREVPYGASDPEDSCEGEHEESPSLNEYLLKGTVAVVRGEVSSSGSAPELPPIPLLTVRGGVVPLPLLEDCAILERLVAIANPSPHGRGTETLVDAAVRSSLELPGREAIFRHPEWQSGLEKVVQRVSTALGCSDGGLRAEPYKLLLYRKGDHFLPHRDTEKEPGMVATLIVQLPSIYQGGELVMRHGGEESTCDLGNGRGSLAAQYMCHYAAHYADVEHEILRVKGGVRLAMVYNLVWTASSTPRTIVPRRGTILADAIKFWTECVDPKMFTLHHVYSSQAMKQGPIMLKGADKDLWEELEAANALLPEEQRLRVSLVRVSRSINQEWDEEQSYYGEVNAVVEYATESVFTRARTTKFTLKPTRDFVYFCPKWSFWNNFSRSKQYTGNEGNTYHTTYTQSGILVWSVGHEVELFLNTHTASKLAEFVGENREKLKAADDSMTKEQRLRLEKDTAAMIAGIVRYAVSLGSDAVFASFLSATQGLPEMLTIAEMVVAKRDMARARGACSHCPRSAVAMFKYLLSIGALSPHTVNRDTSPAIPNSGQGMSFVLTDLTPPEQLYVVTHAAVTEDIASRLRSNAKSQLSPVQLRRLSDLCRASFTGFVYLDVPALLCLVADHALGWELVGDLVGILVNSYKDTVPGTSHHPKFWSEFIRVTAVYSWNCMAPLWELFIPNAVTTDDTQLFGVKQLWLITEYLTSNTELFGAEQLSPNLRPLMKRILPLLTTSINENCDGVPIEPLTRLLRAAAVADDRNQFDGCLAAIFERDVNLANDVLLDYQSHPFTEEWQHAIIHGLAPAVIRHQATMPKTGAFSWRMTHVTYPHKQLEDFFHSDEAVFRLYGFSGARTATLFLGTLQPLPFVRMHVEGKRNEAHIVVEKNAEWHAHAVARDKLIQERIQELSTLLATTPPPARDCAHSEERPPQAMQQAAKPPAKHHKAALRQTPAGVGTAAAPQE